MSKYRQMSKGLQFLDKIGEVCFILLAIVAMAVSVGYMYYHYFVHEETIGVNYVGAQIPVDLAEKADELSPEEIADYESRLLFEINYYSNDKNNGIELQELNMSYFTDYTLGTSAARATGLQNIGEFTLHSVDTTQEEGNAFVNDKFYYYDTQNLISWSGGKTTTQMNRNAVFTIKIDNRPYAIQLDKYGVTTEKGLFGVERKIYTLYTWDNVFYDLIQAVKTNSRGYGDYYLEPDLSNYFTVREYNPETGKFVEDLATDIVKNYAVIKFHYDENGANNATQSLFNQIECNRSYGVTDTDYWQERITYDLDLNDLDLRYSKSSNGYYVSLPTEVREVFKTMPRAKVNITLNIDSGNKILGLDFEAFKSFEIDTLTILGSDKQFRFQEGSLVETNVQKIKVSSTVDLLFANGSTDEEIPTEVIA